VTTCTACGRNVGISRDGVLLQHENHDGDNCLGSGKLPGSRLLQELVREVEDVFRPSGYTDYVAHMDNYPR
jgi:hypothetical protein